MLFRSENNEFLTDNLIPELLSLTDIKSILTNLIREKVSIKNITYVFEKMNDFATHNTDRIEMLDNIRLSLAKQICKSYINENGTIEAFSLSENSIIKFGPLFSMNEDFGEEDEFDDMTLLDMDYVEKFVAKLKKQAQKFGLIQPLIVVPIEVRSVISALLNKYCDVIVLAKEEINYNAKLDVLASI